MNPYERTDTTDERSGLDTAVNQETTVDAGARIKDSTANRADEDTQP